MIPKVPNPVCILPMNNREFDGQPGCAVQQKFFLTELPSRNGKYWYRKAGLRPKSGLIVLFQYDNEIIASATLKRVERFDEPDDGYYGIYHFDVESIRTFDPVAAKVIREVWPEKFKRLGNTKQYLRGASYPAFERRLTGIGMPG